MLLDLTFILDAEPLGKGRPRVSCRNGRPSVYTPAKTRFHEQRIHRAAQRAGVPQIPGPVRVDIAAISKRPKRLKRKKDKSSLLFRTTKPDADNVRKAVLDGLSKFFDDKQVVSGDTLSLYAEKDSERGRIIVRISTDVGDPAQLLSQLFPEKSSECLKTESSSP